MLLKVTTHPAHIYNFDVNYTSLYVIGYPCRSKNLPRVAFSTDWWPMADGAPMVSPDQVTSTREPVRARENRGFSSSWNFTTSVWNRIQEKSHIQGERFWEDLLGVSRFSAQRGSWPCDGELALSDGFIVVKFYTLLLRAVIRAVQIGVVNSLP